MLPSTTNPNRSKQKRLLGLFGGKKANHSTLTVNQVDLKSGLRESVHGEILFLCYLNHTDSGMLTDLESGTRKDPRFKSDTHQLLLADESYSTTPGTEQNDLELTKSRLGQSVLGEILILTSLIDTDIQKEQPPIPQVKLLKILHYL